MVFMSSKIQKYAIQFISRHLITYYFLCIRSTSFYNFTQLNQSFLNVFRENGNIFVNVLWGGCLYGIFLNNFSLFIPDTNITNQLQPVLNKVSRSVAPTVHVLPIITHIEPQVLLQLNLSMKNMESAQKYWKYRFCTHCFITFSSLR